MKTAHIIQQSFQYSGYALMIASFVFAILCIIYWNKSRSANIDSQTVNTPLRQYDRFYFWMSLSVFTACILFTVHIVLSATHPPSTWGTKWSFESRETIDLLILLVLDLWLVVDYVGRVFNKKHVSMAWFLILLYVATIALTITMTVFLHSLHSYGQL